MKEKNKQEDGYLTFFENIKKHPYLTILLLIVIFIVIPISFYVENPLGLGFIPPDIAGNVLEYYGAILGGLLTLIGVAWTIKYQDNKQKEDFMKMHKPIITIDSIEYSDYNSVNTLGFNIVFKNQGLTEAYNLEIWVHLKNNESNQCSAYCNPSYYNVLPYGSSLSVQATHIELLERYGDFVEGIVITVTYDDAYKNNYTVEQIADFHRNIDNDLNAIKLSNYNLVNKRTRIPVIQKQL